MKKIIVWIIAMIMAFVFAGCGAPDTAEQSTETVQQTQEAQAGTQAATQPQKAVDENTVADVDLTGMSTTMAYSEVFNMVSYPDEYEGKTVKMKGLAASYYDDELKETYYACIVQDATACCAEGLEYILGDSGTYPDNDKEITVVGVFRKCVAEDGFEYGRIENARLL